VKPGLKQFAWKPAAWLAVAGAVQGATVVFLGGPVEFLVPGILAAAALHIGLFERTELPGGRMLKRGVALLFVAVGAWLAVPETDGPGIRWQDYAPDLVEAAQRGGRPVMIDFTSRTCAPCREMDRKVFRRGSVTEAAGAFLALRADMTADSEDRRRLATQFRIEGYPTIVFLDTNGVERTNLRLVGFERAEDFLIRLQQAR
jgi:thiol:disulfide interchange protein